MDKNELFKKFLSLSDHDKCMLFATLWGRLEEESGLEVFWSELENLLNSTKFHREEA